MARQPLIILVLISTFILGLITYYSRGIGSVSIDVETYIKIKTQVDKFKVTSTIDMVLVGALHSAYKEDFKNDVSDKESLAEYDTLTKNVECLVEYAYKHQIEGQSIPIYRTKELPSNKDKNIVIVGDIKQEAATQSNVADNETYKFTAVSLGEYTIKPSYVMVEKTKGTICHFRDIKKSLDKLMERSLSGHSILAFGIKVDIVDVNTFINYKESPLKLEAHKLVQIINKYVQGDGRLATWIADISGVLDLTLLSAINILLIVMNLFTRKDLRFRICMIVQIYVMYVLHIAPDLTNIDILMITPIYTFYTILQVVAWHIYPMIDA